MQESLLYHLTQGSPCLESGITSIEIDLLTGASINDIRKKYATFSDGYRTESFQLYVRAGEVNKFEGYNTSKGDMIK